MAKTPLGIQVVARAAALLRALEGCEQGVSLGQLAKRLSLPKSTVQRIVAALEQEKFVISAAPQSGVRLGPALVRIARSVRYGLTEVAHASLVALAERTGETVELAVQDGAKAIFVDHIEGSQRLRAVSATGFSIPLHCSAIGKAMLAALDEDSLRKISKRMALTRLTPNTICKWSRLERELDTARRTGIAFDNEEHTLGISAIGVALPGPGGENAAISIPVPSVRFAGKLGEIKEALLECRREIAAKFSAI